MTITEVISHVQDDTEHKLDTQIDWRTKFIQVLQELCGSHLYWWRKKSLTFSTVANTAIYDLTSITTTPAGAGVFIEQITEVVRQDTAPNICELDAVTDDLEMAGFINDTSTDKPAVWMPDTSQLDNPQSIRLGKIPNGIFTMQVFFWAMPNPDQDSADDKIYILPKFLHHVVQTGLEAEVRRISYGAQDPKYITARDSYKEKKAAAKVRTSLDGKKVSRFMNQSGESIRSTRGGEAIRSTGN